MSPARGNPAPRIADEEADVVVAGAGLSGVLAGEHIARNGLSCTILEAGPVLDRRLPSCNARHYKEASAPLLEVDPHPWAYRTEGEDADWVRVRAGGGRSLLWGGWLLRPPRQCLLDAERFGRPWPFSHDDMQTHIWRAARALGAREANLEPQFSAVTRDLGLAVEAKRVAPGPCGCRASVSLDLVKATRIRAGSVVTRVLLDSKKRAEGVEFTDVRTGARGVVRARAVVLAASPIETARLLLESLQDLSIEPYRHIGRGLVDHFVAGRLVLVPGPAPSDEPASPFRRAAFVPRFVNLGRAHRRDYVGGFSVELHGPDPLCDLDDDTLNRLGVPRADASGFSFHTVHAVGELAPDPARFMTIDPDSEDAFGRPVPVLHLAWTENEKQMARDMEETATAVADALAPPRATIFPIRETLGRFEISHEAGTCRMGRSSKNSVVNLAGQVHGVPGLFVADASLLPTALDRPHTLPLLALALNTADGVLEFAGRRSSGSH
ncbi:MAG: GMC family oxidoreductase [Deltaproteobacteria bacterium]|nr:GMC family oxidoreductase [Deltaproteobacteria bacterium]